MCWLFTSICIHGPIRSCVGSKLSVCLPVSLCGCLVVTMTSQPLIQSIVNGMTFIEDTVMAQLYAGVSPDEARQRLCESYYAQLSNVSQFTADDVVLLNEHIARSPFNPAQKSRLSSVVVASPEPVRVHVSLPDRQNCVWLENFITDEKWAAFATCTLPDFVCKHLLAEQMYAINIDYPNEATVNRAVRIYVTVQRKLDVTPAQVRNWSDDIRCQLRKLVVSKGMPPGVPRIQQYCVVNIIRSVSS